MTERRTEGNLQLIEAAEIRLIELLKEHDGIEGVINILDLPFDETSAQFFMPTIEELISLSLLIHVDQGKISGEAVTAIGVSEEFASNVAAMQARSFLTGYVAAKMEVGQL